jgi:hypothetical protein
MAAVVGWHRHRTAHEVSAQPDFRGRDEENP